MFPCAGMSATNQVNEMVDRLGGSNYGTVWIDIETNPSGGCSWADHSPADNCAFIAEAIGAVQARGKVAGIYSNYY